MTAYPDLLGSPLIGYDPDAVLAAAEAVRSYCGWHIAPAVEETVTLDGSGGRHLLLPSLHVTEVSEIVADLLTRPRRVDAAVQDDSMLGTYLRALRKSSPLRWTQIKKETERTTAPTLKWREMVYVNSGVCPNAQSHC